MDTVWAKVAAILQHLGINYERRDWLYLCDVAGRQFYYSPQTGKWRIKGKKIWKSSRTVRDFITQARAYSSPETRTSQSQKEKANSQNKSRKKQQKQSQEKQWNNEQWKTSGEKSGQGTVKRIRREFLEIFGYLLQKQREKRYKKGWIWYALIEQCLPTLEEICWLGVVLDYSPRWAVYKVQEIYGQANPQLIFAVLEKCREEWWRYFQNRWGLEEERQESRERGTQRKEKSGGYALRYQVYLEVLQLSFPFTHQELKSAYRRRALETHPDSGGTAEAFREVHAAYQVLLQSY